LPRFAGRRVDWISLRDTITRLTLRHRIDIFARMLCPVFVGAGKKLKKMNKHDADQKRWLALAAEARASAERLTDRDSRQSLLAVAARYEALAARARRRAAIRGDALLE
jgi:hypothetical protein